MGVELGGDSRECCYVTLKKSRIMDAEGKDSSGENVVGGLVRGGGDVFGLA